MAPSPIRLSAARARRIAIAAQGLAAPRPAQPGMRQITAAIDRIGLLQVDSVNVLTRAQYLPLFARLGGYDRGLLDRASGKAPRRLIEYWAHVQAVMPVGLWPVMSHRMAFYRSKRGKWWGKVSDELAARVLEQVRDRGASTARELDHGAPRQRDNWGWNWSDERKALDYLYMCGDLAIAGRNGSFEVRYDLPERVLPAAVLSAPTVTEEEADVELVRRAARAHGVATVACLGDYYRMGGGVATGTKRTQRAVNLLVESGELLPAQVDGWTRPAYLHRDARVPRQVQARALLAPFDPLVWFRWRVEALWDFHYRIEIYVPPEKRVFGYYVLPFLLGERLVARVDLKADRPAGNGSGVFRVRSA